MKTISPSLGVLAVCLLLFTSCTDKKKQFRDQLAKECIETGQKQFSDPAVKKQFRDYCNCSAAKIADKVTKEEFEKMKAEGRQADMQATIMPIVEPCLNELEQKMGGAK